MNLSQTTNAKSTGYPIVTARGGIKDRMRKRTMYRQNAEKCTSMVRMKQSECNENLKKKEQKKTRIIAIKHVHNSNIESVPVNVA